MVGDIGPPREAIELCMGGHQVTVSETRWGITDSEGNLTQLGAHEPHQPTAHVPFVRNDIARN